MRRVCQRCRLRLVAALGDTPWLTVGGATLSDAAVDKLGAVVAGLAAPRLVAAGW